MKEIANGGYSSSILDIHWKIRTLYVDSKLKIIRYFLYCLIKRIEAYHNSETEISFHDPCAVYDSRPVFPEGLKGIVISRKAHIGKNVIIHPFVTIGTRMTTIKAMDPRDTIAPLIGDNVVIMDHAKIIGPVKIGNNVVIKPYSVVTKDVPDNCIIEGNPAIIR